MFSTRNRPLLLGAPLLPAFPRIFHPPGAARTSQDATAAPGTGTIATLAAGNTTFAFDLYRELARNTDSNLVSSPYSISLALAMAYAGSGGETAAQIEDTLAFTLSEPDLHEAFNALTADLVERATIGGDEGALHLANALWIEQTYPLNSSYSAEIEAFYGAALHLVDFANAPEESRLEINDWVAGQTDDRIQDIVPKGDIDDETILALVNAIHFLGAWEHQFEVWQTRDDDFTLQDGNPITLPFMVQTLSVLTARGDGFQAIELPYGSSGFSMTIICPDHASFDDVTEALDADLFIATIGDLDWNEVRLFIPKFRFGFGTIELQDILASLGMPLAFSTDADFCEMTDLTRAKPRDCPRIARVLHKAFISVDEAGTEAAAATVVLASPAGSPPLPEPPPEIRIDRPFFFAIRDRKTGTILFLGRVMDPRG